MGYNFALQKNEVSEKMTLKINLVVSLPSYCNLVTAFSDDEKGKTGCASLSYSYNY